jgi:predicted phosphodiesterase
MGTIAALAIGLVGCAAGPEKRVSQGVLKIRIGLLADTQVTSKVATSGYLFRSPIADLIENVAIRTVAQEHLSAEHLGYMLADVAKQGPDLLLYLGDGANSGCRDEVDSFLKVLSDGRESLHLPTFVVVGNHDYLATGNQADRSQRLLACNDRDYLTKAQIVRAFADFNRQSWELLRAKNALWKAFQTSEEQPAVRSACLDSPENRQDEAKCFYAGVLKFSDGETSGEIILTDTSDYFGIRVQPRIAESKELEGKGLRGSISWGSADSQVAWLGANLSRDVAPTRLRIVASHYPTKDLGWTKAIAGRAGDLLLEDGTNVWLSGHTHEPNPDAVPRSWVRTLGTRSVLYQEVNVGSTTDYLPHGAVVDIGSSGAKRQAVRSMSAEDVAACRLEIDALNLTERYGSPVAGCREPRVLLGLTTHYRNEGYREEVARENIARFLGEATTGTERERRVRCLLNVASRNEFRASWKNLFR